MAKHTTVRAILRLLVPFVLVVVVSLQESFGQSLAIAESSPSSIASKPATRKAYFNGGANALQEQLAASLKTQAVTTDTRVLVKAIVNADGQLVNIRVIESNSSSATAAATYAVSKLKDWQPALTNGVPYASEVIIPIQFKVAVKSYLSDF